LLVAGFLGRATSNQLVYAPRLGFPMATFDDDPDHPILDNPFSWELLELTYRRDRRAVWQSHIDMVFEREGETRRLRFYNPRSIEWCPGGVPNSNGMCILDVTRRQMEGISVRVANFEQSHGAPTFWAERVIDLDDPNHEE
jgi:hypothetical protein